jgi:hypothetical protein
MEMWESAAAPKLDSVVALAGAKHGRMARTLKGKQ